MCLTLNNPNYFTPQQYLFSDDVTDFTVETLKKLSAQHVICIGTPTVHEALIYGECRRDMKSLLLDIDVRLV